MAVGNHYSVIRGTYRTLSDVYKYSEQAQDFKLYGQVDSNGVTQIRFFQPSYVDNILVSVTNQRGRCNVFEMDDEQAVGNFQKYQNFEALCAAMELFEHEQKGDSFFLGDQSKLNNF